MKNKNGSAWTAADVPDLRGRVVVVTGANSGIANRLAFSPAPTRFLASRNTVTGEKARERLARLEPEGSTEVLPIELANLESVQGFAAEFTRRHDRLDVLVNNAGVTFIPSKGHRRLRAAFRCQQGLGSAEVRRRIGTVHHITEVTQSLRSLRGS